MFNEIHIQVLKKKISSTLNQNFNLIFNPKVSSPVTHLHHYSGSTVGEVRHILSFLLDFFPPLPSSLTCFLGFPEPVRNLEKQGEVLYLHFSLPASHWLSSNISQFGRYKNVGFLYSPGSAPWRPWEGLAFHIF